MCSFSQIRILGLLQRPAEGLASRRKILFCQVGASLIVMSKRGGFRIHRRSSKFDNGFAGQAVVKGFCASDEVLARRCLGPTCDVDAQRKRKQQGQTGLATEGPFREKGFEQQQERGQHQPRHQEVLKVDVADRRDLSAIQAVFELQERCQLHVALRGPGVRASSSLCGFHQRCLVQTRDHGLTAFVGAKSRRPASRIHGRNGSALQGGEAEEVNRAPFVPHLARCEHDVVFVVFAVGEDNHDSRSFAVVVETVPTGFHSASHGCPLGGNHARVNAFKEHLDGFDVCGQGTLHVGFAGEYHEPHAISGRGGEQAFDRSFGQI